MTPHAWAETGIGDGPDTDPPVWGEREALVWIRYAYVTGYTDSLKGENEIIDPCLAALALSLSIPVD